MKGKARAINLEEDRQCIAQSFTELVMDSWPRIYKIPPEPWRTSQMRQDRIKTATRLKDAIVTFWSVQSYFQERAELILDVQQVKCGNSVVSVTIEEEEERKCFKKCRVT